MVNKNVKSGGYKPKTRDVSNPGFGVGFSGNFFFFKQGLISAEPNPRHINVMTIWHNS